jgi:hypothetical protein
MQPTSTTPSIDGPAAGETSQSDQSVSDQAQAKASELADQAQEKAQQAAGQAKGKLREQIDQRSQQAAEQVNRQASDLRAVSDALREQGKDGPANAAGKVAGYAEKVGSYLHERDADALLADAEDFGRRRPWAVAAGGLVLGFAASRFLKASSSRRYSDRFARRAGQPDSAAAGYPPPPGPESPDPNEVSAAPSAPMPRVGAVSGSSHGL